MHKPPTKTKYINLIGWCCKQSRQSIQKNTHESSRTYVHMYKEIFFNLTSDLRHMFSHTQKQERSLAIHTNKKVFRIEIEPT